MGNSWLIIIDNNGCGDEEDYSYYFVDGTIEAAQNKLNTLMWDNRRWGFFFVNIYNVLPIGHNGEEDMLMKASRYCENREAEYRRKEEEAKAEKKRLAEEKKKADAKHRKEREYELYLELKAKYEKKSTKQSSFANDRSFGE